MPYVPARRCEDLERARLSSVFSRSPGWLLLLLFGLAGGLPAGADVIISEFMAANRDTLLDGNGVASDWIELENTGAEPVDLAGWHLTDDSLNLTRWTFPSVALGSGQFLIVFASGHGVPDPAGHLHTDFQLNSDGGFLALVRPDLSIATQFAPAYPPQREDVSFGLAERSFTTNWVASGTRGRLLVPGAGSDVQPGQTWQGANEPFADASWLAVTNPVGYDAPSAVAPSIVNVALGRPVFAPADTWPGLPKENLTDGNLSTFTHNNVPVPNFYFLVDLGGTYQLENIELFNRNDGCCPERLSNYTVTLLADGGSDATPGPAVWSASVRTNGSNSGIGGRDLITPELDPKNTLAGRWIQVQARSDSGDRYFQIAELRANAANWARGAQVLASGPTFTGLPQENLTDGDLSTVTHNLNLEAAFAFQVRLTQSVALTRLELFNRADGCCPDRLSNYRVSIHPDVAGSIGPAAWSADVRTDNSNSGVGGVDVLTAELDPAGSFEGQWIQIQNLDVGTPRYLQIAELRAFGLGGSSGYGSVIRSDVSALMKGINSTIWLRLPFPATNLAGFDRVTLRARYDDGFVAYLNGTEVARANAPAGVPPYNAQATASHFAATGDDFDVPLNLLRSGTNLLALRGLNLNLNDRDLLLFPELVAHSRSTGAYGYLTKPSPGQVNGSNVVAGFVESTRFNIDRGFYDSPIDVIITSPTPGATLSYTTNSANPSLTNGVVLIPPNGSVSLSATVRVSTTTIVRAAAFKSGLQPSGIDTHTYIFLNDVLRQPANPPGFPASWSGSSADYAIDAKVVSNTTYRSEILNDLRSIRTLSIVLNPPDLFGSGNGIYYFSDQVGDAWERAASVELINPDGSSAFQVDCGMRIWGTGWRPNSVTPKHALQLKFQDQYGPRKLHYPLFPDSLVTEFDNLVLRAQGSKGWTDTRQPDILQTQYIHDSWARDTSRAMGRIEGHATYVHLYLNGLYWGLYNPVEKTDEGFAEVHFGGDKSEYDVITRRGGPEVDAGDITAWNQLMTIVNGGLDTPEQYAAVQQYLDVDDFIDYMMIHQYASNHDGPTFGIANNMRAIRRRVPGGQFRFFVWDMEYTFWYPLENNLGVDTDQSPARIFQRLRANPEFRLRFGDHAQRHLLNQGALTPGPAAARWQARADEIHGAIVGESARWGDTRRPGNAYTRDVEWAAELNRLLYEYFPVRTQIYLDQLRAAGLYPKVPPPAFSQQGGDIPPGFNLAIDAPGGIVYYTVDGTDPRLVGGGVAPGALAYIPNTPLVTTSSTVRVLVPLNGTLGAAWNGSDPSFNDITWLTGPNSAGFDSSLPAALSLVPLQNASADFSENGRSVGLAIDNNPATTGWGVFEQQDYAPKGRGSVAVFETITNIGFAAGTRLVFTLRHGVAGQLTLGKFRLSATTDDRDTFADGLAARGDIVATWTPLLPLTVTAAAGGTMTINPDASILVSGANPSTNVYTVTVITPIQGMTGFRIEAMEDSSLPSDGPGRSGNGDAVLTDFSVQAAPANLTHLLDTSFAGQVQAAMQNHNSSAYLRFPFTTGTGTNFERLTLRVRYDDGFVAYLNGHEVARRNAPAVTSWNSASVSDRPRGQALDFEVIDLGDGRTNLLAGPNILAFQALNDAASGNDFLLQAELIGHSERPIPLADSTTVEARVLSNGEWSALNQATFNARFPLRCTEIMYNPPDQGLVSGDEFEFIEFQNVGTTVLDLSGLTFSSGITFTFTNRTFLAPGALFLLARNPVQFAARYPGVTVNGVYSGKLDNSGESITLSRPLGATVLSVTYGDDVPWPLTPDGFGFSLVPRDPAAPTSSNPADWRASAAPLGSPGVVDPDPGLPPILLNEILTASVFPALDKIELYNPTGQAVSIGGWFLTDERAVPMKFRIPNALTISAGGYLVFDETNFNPAPGSLNSFSLSSEGESVYLFSGDAATNLTGYSHGFSFGAAETNVSFGRYVISTGEEQFPAQTVPSFGAANAGPFVGPVVLNEIMYHPPPGGDEYLELKNITSGPVSLFDPVFPTNHWKLSGLDYTLPAGVVLPPNGFALLVSIEPALFRAKYGVPAEVQIFGPYPGQLQDSGERLELKRPGPPTSNGVAAITVDEVRYNDKFPWPLFADGFGPSLQRLNPAAYGNDPANWRAAAPGLGRDFAGGVAPFITVQPANQSVVRHQPALLNIGAGGTAPLFYQWQLLGTNVPGATNVTLALASTELTQAGGYRVTVFNSAGAVTSAVAVLTVLNPPVISVQPQGRTVAVGSNVLLSVTATGNGVLHYQWQFNGAPLAGFTGPSLTLTNLQESQSGQYAVMISDDIGSITSEPAIVLAITRPVITSAPQNVTVVAGDTVTLRVSADGSLPLGFRWRRNGAIFTNFLLFSHTSALTFTNVQVSQGANYSVLITNLISSGISTTNATLTVLADSDGDHMADIWEIAAGTDPNDPTSFLRIERVGVTNVATITFAAVSNRTYGIQYRDQLGAPSWLTLTNLPAAATNRLQNVTDPSPQPNRFYRLVTP